MGNKHLIVVDDTMQEHNFQKITEKLLNSKLLETHNIHFACNQQKTKNSEKLSQHLGVQVRDSYKAWSIERGAGITKACGSGACSIAAAGFESAFSSRDELIEIVMPVELFM